MAAGLTTAHFRRAASRLVYRTFGAPSQVVELEEFDDPKVETPREVVVRMLAAPVHPSNLNTIQGTYPLKPSSFPAVGGREGVGRVVEVGDEVESLKVGDIVYPQTDGTWTTHMKSDFENFDKMGRPSGEISPLTASILRVNPGTAYRMLRDIVDLKPKDVVVQNGSNGAVGEAVIQIARAMGVVTVNIVRNRKNLAELITRLKSLGADHVWTEEELRCNRAFKEGQIPAAKLALNCVGGSSSTELSRCLGDQGVHVTYGGMSLKPVIASTSSLVFKDISFRGFWYSRWTSLNHGTAEADQMFSDLETMAAEGTFVPPILIQSRLQDYEKVLQEGMKGFRTGKTVFVMSGD